jgi:hypothetical protein
MNPRRRNQQRVVETTKGIAHYRTRARRDLSVDRMDPVAEVGDDTIEPFIEIVAMRPFRGDSSNCQPEMDDGGLREKQGAPISIDQLPSAGWPRRP